MNRRDFLQVSTGFSLAIGCAGREARPAPRRSLLSSQGCGRATAYAQTNKIVTLDGKTHVAWLDSPREGFRVRIRTLDRRTGKWSAPTTVGEAVDNHGGPALTVDSKGYLHLAYYPHSNPMRYRRSLRRNDASAWTDEIRFGGRLTYPALVCGPDDTLYMACRDTADGTRRTDLYVKPPGRPWKGPRTLVTARYAGYSQYQTSMAWGPDHRTLHLSVRVYEGTEPRGCFQTVGYMVSRDFGETWRRGDGTPIRLPATAETIDVLRRGDKRKGEVDLRCGAIAVTPDGIPWILYSSIETFPGTSYLARLGSDGKWTHTSLRTITSDLSDDWGISMPGVLSVTEDGRMIAVLTRFQARPGERLWGHPSNEILVLESWDTGRSFSARLLDPPDPSTPRWLPNLERPTGFNRVGRSAGPGLIYTSGHRGEHGRELMSNEVVWADLTS